MSTNYYSHGDSHGDTSSMPIIHIGQSSAGWSFLLHSMPEHGLTEWPEWELFLQEGVIRDEYDRVIELDDLKRIVCDRPPWEGKFGDTYAGEYIMGGLFYRQPSQYMPDLRNGEHGTYQITEAEFS